MDKETGLFSQDSRRSFLQKSAVALGSTAGLMGVVQGQNQSGQTATPTGTQEGNQNTGTQQDDGNGGKALMFLSEFRGGAQFKVVSPVLQQQPNVENVKQGDIWSNYNTRMIQYINSNQQVQLFPAQDAQIKQGQVYELHDNFTWFADSVNEEGLIDVRFSPVPENEQVTVDDFDVLEENAGKALVRRRNFRPGGVFTITSGVVDWTPPDNIQESDIFSEYNTRFAEWFNTSNDFNVYPAQDAEVKQGQTYRMSDEFDATDPESNFVTVTLSRVAKNAKGQGGKGGQQGQGGQQQGC